MNTSTVISPDITQPVFDVFISYASSDKNIAFDLCNFLEKKKINCWVAPRNINPGRIYAEAIIEGIRNSSIMVLVFDDAANGSNHVRNEVERAFNHGLTIIPFRIQNTTPADSLEYFLGSMHWLDAFEEEYLQYMPQLHNTIVHALRNRPVIPTEKTNSQYSGVEKKKNKAAIYITSGALIIGLGIAFAIYLFTAKHEQLLNTHKDLQVLKKTDTSPIQSALPTVKKNMPQNESTTENAIELKVDFSVFTGIIYQDYETKSKLQFTSSGNSTVYFQGRGGSGYSVEGTMRVEKDGLFKVIKGNVSGSIQFFDDYKKIRGVLRIKDSDVSWDVNLVKTSGL